MFESYWNWCAILQPSCLNWFMIDCLVIWIDLKSTAQPFALIYSLQPSCLNWYRISCPAIWIDLKSAASYLYWFTIYSYRKSPHTPLLTLDQGYTSYLNWFMICSYIRHVPRNTPTYSTAYLWPMLQTCLKHSPL